MVNDMEGTNVVKLLSGQKEKGVGKFDKLGNVIKVGTTCHPKGFWTGRVVDGLTPVVILSEPAIDT